MATLTTSIRAARPAFAKENCNEDNTVCSGVEGNKPNGGLPGGHGGRSVTESTQSGFETTASGGIGINGGTFVGGRGHHTACDASGCTIVGTPEGRRHPK